MFGLLSKRTLILGNRNSIIFQSRNFHIKTKLLQLQTQSSLSSSNSESTTIPWRDDDKSRVPRHYWEKREHQVEYLEWLSKKLNLESMEDWYKVTSKDLVRNFGTGVLQQFNRSHIKLITSVYSDYPWLPWKFNNAPANYFKDKQNVVLYLNWLGNKLGFTKMEDWYNLSYQILSENNGRSLLDAHGTVNEVLKFVYPEYNWLPWKFRATPSHFWKDKENQLNYMNWLGEKLNLKSMEDWYKIQYHEFLKNSGSGLLKQYQNSPAKTIMSIYNNYDWLPWKFVVISAGYFASRENQERFMKWFANEKNLRTEEDWYQISIRDIQEAGGFSLFEYHSNYPSLLASFFPNYKWLPWRFNITPVEYWKNIENQKEFVEWLSKKLEIKKMEDWYKVLYKDFTKYCGSLLQLYDHSHVKFITTMYPDYNWLPWKFLNTPSSFWKDLKNQRKFLDYLAKELNISEPNHWYNVTNKEFAKHGASGLISLYPSLMELLAKNFPEISWDQYRFTKLPHRFLKLLTQDRDQQENFVKYLEKKFGIKKTSDWYLVHSSEIKEVISLKISEAMTIVKLFYPDLDMKYFQYENKLGAKKSQYKLKSMINTVFPNKEIVEEYRHTDLENLELDYYIPELKLAFEYQGEQHYKNFAFLRPLNHVRKLDALKIEKTKEMGITLIQVPYWWDKKLPSLCATIANARPELITIPLDNDVKAIPLEPPYRSEKNLRKRNEIQSQLMLASNWNKDDDPTNWWMTEKYDGIRVLWTGTQMYTRKGNVMKIPEFFMMRLPPFQLDGELWIKRGLHQASLQLTRTDKESVWKKATFCIFDVPDQMSKTYEERYEFLKNFSKDSQWPSFLHVIEAIKCENREHLEKYYKEITSQKGEGVMLREPESLYEYGRSNAMKRYKEYQDTEVKVIKNMYPHGLECQQMDGQTLFVSVNNEDLEKIKKMKENTVITVKYSGMNIYNKMIQPVFFRTRNSSADMTWSDLVKQYQSNNNNSSNSISTNNGDVTVNDKSVNK